MAKDTGKLFNRQGNGTQSYGSILKDSMRFIGVIKNKMTDTLQTNGENIRTLQNQRASAELQLANLQEELHNSELWKKIEEKQREVRELNDREIAMKDSILAGMIANGLKTVEFTNQRFTAKQNPGSVNIIDEEMIPQNFKKLQTKVVVDKTAIKKAIQAGEEVVGAEVTYGYSLVITPR